MNTLLAWHYTPATKFKLILDSGFLLPTNIGVSPPEKPILWFSLNQKWEATATKVFESPDGTSRRLSMKELYAIAGGLVRFGVDVRQIYVGEELRRRASMSAKVWRRLCDEGLRQKASPSEWCGSVRPIAVADTVVEVMNKNHEWERVSP